MKEREIQQPIENSAVTLSPGFFQRDTVQVARDLLGCRLIRKYPETGESVHLKIVETEAYTQDDPACHAYGKKKGRAEMLYAAPGTAYVYLIYGMYDCLNVVTEPEGVAGAVLFRALEPLTECHSHLRTHGPGRLTKALDIRHKIHNGSSLTDPVGELVLLPGDPVPDDRIIQTTRIGITKAADYPWRFYIAGNRWVSVK